MVQKNSSINIFVLLASLVVILAGIKVASSVVVPFIFSIFIAIILWPMIQILHHRGLAQSLSVFVVIVLFFLFLMGVMMMFGSSAKSFTHNLPQYEGQLQIQFKHAVAYLNNYGIDIPHENLLSSFDPSKVMKYVVQFLNGLGGLITNGFVILLIVIFMLAETPHLKKLLSTNSTASAQMVEIMQKIKHYMALKALISLFTGVIISIALSILGLDYPILWGILAFLLNFIPNIGSIIAAVPAVLLALVQLGFVEALIVSAIFVSVNIGIGSVLEPKIMGKGVGLSSLVVFLSLIFWGWLLGLVGMFLSIPLTIILKIVLASKQETKFFAELLGSSS
jgi:AI-2 transport protein TqsA